MNELMNYIYHSKRQSHGSPNANFELARIGNFIAFHTICFCILLSGIFGCWYSFSERAYPKIKSIGVIPFDNQTGEYELASSSTEMMIQKILSTSTYKLLSVEEADGILSGTITGYERKVNTYDETENPLDYIIRIRARISFVERFRQANMGTDVRGLFDFSSGWG